MSNAWAVVFLALFDAILPLPPVESMEYESPSGAWALRVEPERRDGAGPARASLRQRECVQYDVCLPFTFRCAAVLDDGRVFGVALEWKRDACVCIAGLIDLSGAVLLERRWSWSSRTWSSVAPIGVAVDVRSGQAAARVFDPDQPAHCRDSWRLFDTVNGRDLGGWSNGSVEAPPPPGFEEAPAGVSQIAASRATWSRRARVVPVVELAPSRAIELAGAGMAILPPAKLAATDVDDAGRILAVEARTGRAVLYSSDGRALREILGVRPAVDHPYAALDGDGRVRRFPGEVGRAFGSGGFVFDWHGALLIRQPGEPTRAIDRFPDGTWIRRATDVAEDAGGNVYVRAKGWLACYSALGAARFQIAPPEPALSLDGVSAAGGRVLLTKRGLVRAVLFDCVEGSWREIRLTGGDPAPLAVALASAGRVIVAVAAAPPRLWEYALPD